MKESIIKAIKILFLSCVIGGGIVAASFKLTFSQIAFNEKQTLLNLLNVVLPKQLYDNDLSNDIYKVKHELLGSLKEMSIYRARLHNQPSGAILSVIAPDGYSGEIALLVAVDSQGVVQGVRVTSHRETPGLGDYIEEKRSSWILSFNGASLNQPDEKGWHVKKDGGTFDQFTGATITPRAVVKAVRKALVFYQQHKEEIFK